MICKEDRMSTVINNELLNIWSRENSRLAAFMDSSYLPMLLSAYEELEVSALFRSRTHGQGHIERTMLLGALLAQGEQLPPELTELLLLCCAYHDVGRVSDWLDRKHGERSAEKIAKGSLKEKFSGFSPEDINLALAAICAHSLSDRDMGLVFERCSVPAELEERCTLLSCRLKDADNLDRVRLGDLNPKYLRCPTAKALVDDAQWIYDKYRQCI